MVRDGPDGNRHADRIAVAARSVCHRVDDAQFEGSVERGAITVDADDPVEHGPCLCSLGE